jgi:protein-disulfide isomerase
MHMAFLGQESQWAAEASECAADQDAFWAYRDKLFASQSGENQGAFNKDKLKGFAVELGLEPKAFNDCLDTGKYTQLVQSQSAAAGQLGVTSTPSFFVNDWPTGAERVEDFGKLIEKAKQGVHPPPTPTPLPQGIDFYEVDPNRAGLTYDGSPSLGKSDAGLVLLSFEDFKSAGAAQHVASVESALKSKYVDSGQMRLVVKPLADTAPKAAVAAVCASRQGKFWEFRSLLYQKQAEWTEGDDAAMSGYAKSLGLDQAAFDACLKDTAAQNEVEYATAFGQQIGVPTVPSFLVLKIGAGGKAESSKGLPGAQTLDQIEQAITALQQPPPTPLPVPTPVSVAPEKLASLQVGVDADGNFYRGDPNAPIKLVDFSDFQ